jgi:hypothetical protein
MKHTNFLTTAALVALLGAPPRPQPMTPTGSADGSTTAASAPPATRRRRLARSTRAPRPRPSGTPTSADKHAKGKDTVSKYVSKDYRASIKSTNKAAEKFADTPDQDLLDDIKAFLQKGAKDGDSPATCS